MSVLTQGSYMQSKVALLMACVFACMPTHTRCLHVADADASGEYFDYGIDELGLQDIRAADRVISNVVCNELASS